LIVPKAPQVLRLVQYVGVPLLLLVLYDFAIVFAYQKLQWKWIGSPHVPLGLYGSAIGIIVSFRNNSSYARWWEGRDMWGRIVNNSRSLARQVTATLRPRDANDGVEAATLAEMQRRIVYTEIAYVHAVRQHLRGLSPWEELARVLPAAEVEALRGEANIPLTLLQQIGSMARECEDRGWIDSIGWQGMDGNIDDLTDAQGGCERIKNTPLPKQYDYFPQLFVQIYCLVLPMGMVANLGWFTPVGSTLVGFMFLALDKIGRDLEDPFDNTIFDVPMTSITRNIEINLRQMLGERELPEPEKAIHGVLW
jgi:putative membrane protein